MAELRRSAGGRSLRGLAREFSVSHELIRAALREREPEGRLREAYLDGDLDPSEYQSRKASLTAALSILPAAAAPDAATGRRLAGFLADVASAWKMATPAERSTLARAVMAVVLIDNRTAVAVLPRPELTPFLRRRFV